MTKADKNGGLPLTNKRKMTDEAITPNLQKRLEELFADSPLNDEPLTPEQKRPSIA
jgi:hypothetical protein